MALINEIAEALTLPCRQTRFVQPPKDQPFCVWGEQVACMGDDERPYALKRHESVLVLYEHQEDGENAPTVEAVLDAFRVAWTKAARDWFDDEQLYVTIYTFDYFERTRLEG